MTEVLVVDDERSIREGLKASLSGEGFEVRTARDGDDALRKIAARRPDVVVLDVMMPRMNGFLACEAIRKTDNLLPIIFLTAKDSDVDRVRGILTGADDYVSKDCGEAVLLACINRALSRSRSIGEAAGEVAGGTIRIGKVVVDKDALSVSEDGREIARLTKTEADILAVMDMQRGKIMTPKELVSAIRGRGLVCGAPMLYTHIFNIRRKLGSAGDMLVSMRSAGYGLLK